MATTNWMRIVRTGECLNVEFKQQAPKLERLSKTFSAFANSSGGYVFFGVNDRGEISGLEHPQGTRDIVHKVAQFHCEPPVETEVLDWEPLKGSPVLIVYIPEAPDKPVYAINPNNRRDAWPFFRSDKENLPMDKMSMKTMRNLKALPLEEGLKNLDRHGIKILNMLRDNPRITLGRLAKSANISNGRAKKIMIQLEQFGWVFSYFNETKREFSLTIPWKKR